MSRWRSISSIDRRRAHWLRAPERTSPGGTSPAAHLPRWHTRPTGHPPTAHRPPPRRPTALTALTAPTALTALTAHRLNGVRTPCYRLRMPEPRPVLVVDLGAQYAQLIARRIRECHVYSRSWPTTRRSTRSGPGVPPASCCPGVRPPCYEPGAPTVDPGLFYPRRPGPGHLLRAPAHGAGARRRGRRHRPAGVRGGHAAHRASRRPPAGSRRARAGLDEPRRRGDARRPRASSSPATTDTIPVAAMEDPQRGMFAVQFHPEVAHTPQGHRDHEALPLRRLRLLPDWTPTNVIERSVEAIRAQVGTSEVLCALSGGVDSAVAAAAGPPRGGRAAHLRLRRPRPATARASPTRSRRRSRATSACR